MRVSQPGKFSEKVTKIRATIFHEKILKKCVTNQKTLALKTNTSPLNANLPSNGITVPVAKQ
jgi:hypothetical protein